MRNHRILLLFFFLFLQMSTYAQGGLMFSSNDSIINKRTSYNVFGQKTPTFKKHFYIDFDISLWDTQNLGYIFELITKTNSYSFNYVYKEDGAHLNFNIDSKSNKLSVPLVPSGLGKRIWMKISFDFDLQNDDAVVSIDNRKYRLDNLGIANSIQPTLIFGRNQNYVEVPHMAIRNLKVGDNNTAYFFPLNEWSGNIVHTNSGENVGTVENPVWLINESFFWNKIYDRTFNNIAGLNFDPGAQRLFIFQKDSIIFFDSLNKSTTALAYKNPLPVQPVLGKNIFNAKEDKLYAYEIYNDNKNAVSIASLDMKTLQWQSIGKAKLKEQRHHHNAFYDTAEDSIYIFGGYGGFSYHNAFYTYNQKNDAWKQVPFTGDTITPRFFSAAGSSGNPDEIFIFGGYGNESGSQIVGGRQYYDLFRVNLKKHTIKKCWEIHPKEVFVPANNLILSDDKKYFYALCYPHETFKTFVRLYRFSVKDGSYKIVSAPIPVTSERIETDINLFLDKATNELLCTIQEFQNPKTSDIKVYSLGFPPVGNTDSTKDVSEKSIFSAKEIILLLTTILVLIAIIFSALHIKKRKKAKSNSFSDTNEQPVEDANSAEPASEVTGQNLNDPKKNAVYLLGEFEVYDKKGMNITHLFSPKIKQLFILILLNSRDNLGITSKKISTALWPERDLAKTKNIRSVTFNHLRSILADISDIELVFSDGVYLFDFKEAFFCDYLTVLNNIQRNTSQNEQCIHDCYSLIMRGQLLNDMNDLWLDSYKYDYGKHVVDMLIPKLDNLFLKKDYPATLSSSKLILDIEPFNEIALKYKINCYRKIKGIDYSKKVYEQFAQDYEKSLGESFAPGFEDLLI